MAEYTHSETLDFSVGSNNRLSVRFDGWEVEDKKSFLSEIRSINGVVRTEPTGGATGANVYYDPNFVDPNNLQEEIMEIARDRKYVEKANARGLEVANADFGESPSPIDDQTTNEQRSAHDTSTSTGVATARTKLREVRVLLPSAMHFVEALIGQAGMLGHNGGPEALMPADIEQLRPLHQALGELLEMSDAKDWDDQRFEGLIADIGRFSKTVQTNLANDKPYAAGLAMISAIIGMFNPVAGVGLAAAGIINKGQK